MNSFELLKKHAINCILFIAVKSPIILLDADDQRSKGLIMARLSLTKSFAEIQSSTVFKVIRWALSITAFSAWALSAYARVEDPNINPEVIPANEEIWKWGLRVSTSIIYFMLRDLVTLVVETLTKWHELSPERRLGTSTIIFLILVNSIWSVRERRSRKALSAKIKSTILPEDPSYPTFNQSPVEISDQQDYSSKVFISYSHESKEHKDRVLRLAQRLRKDGVNCDLDRYDTNPKKGWRRWMENQIKEASYVLVICTQTYCRRFEGKEEDGKGLGVKWEAAIIAREIYENDMHNERFLPIIFTEPDRIHIPDVLRDFTFYQIDDPDGYDTLYRKLTNQPKIDSDQFAHCRRLTNNNPTNNL
ncbi:MAG: toll/interleukin-1 receptor domain-containing protein [Blastocatellia bacterium]